MAFGFYILLLVKFSASLKKLFTIINRSDSNIPVVYRKLHFPEEVMRNLNSQQKQTLSVGRTLKINLVDALYHDLKKRDICKQFSKLI